MIKKIAPGWFKWASLPLIAGAVVLTGGIVAGDRASLAGEKNWGPYQAGERRSGYTYMTDATRAIQDDDFENPGMLWVERGETLWSTVDGEAGKSCSSCHGDAAKSMKKVGVTYPVFSKKLGKLESVQQRINRCRTDNMKAKPWKWESESMLSMAVYVNNQARGLPMSVKVDGDAAPFFAKGKAFYNQRRGQLDLACKHCHADHPGGQLRANILSEGQGTGFPTYRLKWQKVGSIHRRFRGCNKQVRAKPYGYGSDEYVNLELYVKWRSRGLQAETPAVRN